MLTDDDLTRELGDAFRAATAEMTYTGRTRPRRRMVVALPAVAGVVVLAAVTAGALDGSSATHQHARTAAAGAGFIHPAPVRPATTSGSPASNPVLVTKTMKLDGFTISFQRAAGDPDPVFAETGLKGLPTGVRRVPATRPGFREWIGKDPKTGDNALYVKAPNRSGRQLFALLSPTWSQQRLIKLFEAPSPVPAVSADSGRSGS
jgi:hypothetical protein